MSAPSRSPSRSQARSTARLAAVQALYQREMEGTALTRLLDEFHQHRIGEDIEDEPIAEAEIAFFDDIVSGVDARQEEIDTTLAEYLAEGWSLKRLDRTMLQILRCGAYELMARPDVPTGAAIGEYIDLAKAFFDDREAKFVNGVLDRVAKSARGG